MPYDNTGTFTIINSCEQDRINNVSIDSEHMDENFNDIASGLSQAMLRNGQYSMNGALNMNNYKIQNVANGTATKDAINKSQLDSAVTTLNTSINAKADNTAVVKLTGNQTIAGTKTFSSTIAGSINGNAATVTNGVYTTGNQSIAGNKTFSGSTTLSGSTTISGTTTVSGSSTFSNNVTISRSGPVLNLDQTDITKGTAPQTDQSNILRFRDTAGNTMGSVVNKYFSSTKTNQMYMGVAKANSSSDDSMAYLTLMYPASGNPYATAPHGDMSGSGKVVTTADSTKSADGFFKFGNGLIIQWGRITNNTGSGTVDLPTAFTSKYSTVMTYHNSDGLGSNRGHVVIKSQTLTSFTYSSDSASDGLHWLAIGF